VRENIIQIWVIMIIMRLKPPPKN